MKPKIKLLIKIMSRNMACKDMGQCVANLAIAPKFAKEAKEELEGYINRIRQADGADPSWTDDEICQMILEKL